MSDEHRCNLPNCDGTRLGHELARDFPEETRKFVEAWEDLFGPREDHVMPENLQVESDEEREKEQ